MRKTHLSILATVMLLGAIAFVAAQPAVAADAKPLVTVSLSGYDAVKADLDYLGKLGGNAELPNAVENMLKMVTQGKGLEGLDTTRPIGAAVFPNPTEPLSPPDLLAFVPVNDMEKLLAVLGGATGVPTSDGPNGSKQIAPEMFVKQVGNWAFLSNKAENFDKAPADPVALLGGAEKKYDLAVRLLVGDMPEAMRAAVVAQLDGFAAIMAMQGPNQASAAQFQQAIGQIKKLINDLDTLTLGFVINDAAGKTYLDIEITAKSGTETAAELAEMKNAPSGYAGFYMPEATITGNWVGKMSAMQITQTVAYIENMHKEFLQALENQDLAPETLDQAKKLVGDLVAVLTETVKSGKRDGGLAVWLDAKTATVAGGSAIVDGEKLDATLKEIVALATKDSPELQKFLKLDAETYQGVKLHTFNMPLPPDVPNREKVVALVGENLEAVVGTAPTGAYIAVGRDAMTKLKAAMDASKSATGDVLPTRGSLAVVPLAQFIASIVDDDDAKQKIAMVAGILESAGSEGHVLLTVEAIANGVRERVEIEQGLLKALSAMSSKMVPGGPTPGGPTP